MHSRERLLLLLLSSYLPICLHYFKTLGRGYIERPSQLKIIWPTGYTGQLSLAIPPWVGALSTSESWDVNRHTARCTSPVSVHGLAV